MSSEDSETSFAIFDRLIRVVPIGRSETIDGVTVTLLSLEIYADGFLIVGSIAGEKIRTSYDDISRIGVTSSGINLSIIDNYGNSYAPGSFYGSGHGSKLRFAQVLTPGLDLDISEIKIIILQVIRTTTSLVYPRTVSDRSTVSGPWLFSVSLTDT